VTTSAPTRHALDDELESLRGPLTGYCYRMLGAAADADDAVQETMLRATRSLDRFDPRRARLTTWVHRIATNVCLDMLRGAGRRALSVDLGPASDGPEGLGTPLPPERFVEPMPDSRLITATDPAEVIVQRESVRLAFVAALQALSPRERATLVLRDVLAFSAQESADILGTSVPAVTSALQRARARLEASRPAPDDIAAPEDPAQHDLLRRYIAAFEAHDVAALTALLREDAVTSMPPFAWWMRGAAAIARLMAASDACARDRLLPTAINGGPGLGQYRPDGAGVLQPFALVLLEVRGGLVAQTVTFLGTGARFAEFGLPAHP